MERVLVSLCFVLVLEAVGTVCARILFLTFVSPVRISACKLLCVFVSVVQKGMCEESTVTYLRSCSVSNFFGFLGQHSHIRTLCACDKLLVRL